MTGTRAALPRPNGCDFAWVRSRSVIPILQPRSEVCSTGTGFTPGTASAKDPSTGCFLDVFATGSAPLGPFSIEPLIDTTLDPDEESAMAAPTAHPSDQTLQSYGLGKLDDLLAEAVVKHLKECDSCRRRVA